MISVLTKKKGKVFQKNILQALLNLQRLLWHHFVTLSLSLSLVYKEDHTVKNHPSFSLKSPLLNISKCQSGFVSFTYTFESKSWFKFEFHLILEFKIWICLNSKVVTFFQLLLSPTLSSSLRLQFHQCLAYCNMRNLQTCIICRYA